MQLHSHPPLPLKSKALPDQKPCVWLCPCVSKTSAANMPVSLHAPQAGHCTTTVPEWLQTPQHTQQAKRLPDVNKHSSIFPSKWLNHCCGQCCLTRVMSDDVAGSVLVVLMYGGAFHDLLKSCGEGGMCSTTMLSLLRSKSSVKTDNWVENGDGTTYRVFKNRIQIHAVPAFSTYLDKESRLKTSYKKN